MRELTAPDADTLAAIISEPRVFATLGDETQPTIEQIRDLIQMRVEAAQEGERTRYDLGIDLDGSLIGLCTLSKLDSRNGTAELSYFVDAAQWGKGYASEAARLVVEHGFTALGLHRIWATVDPVNIGSQKVMHKIGMSLEGYLRGDKIVQGQRRDSMLFARLATDPAPA